MCYCILYPNLLMMSAWKLSSGHFLGFDHFIVSCSLICNIKNLFVSAINLCNTLNGGCQHTCISTGSGTRRCSCNFGYHLQADGTTCNRLPLSKGRTNHNIYRKCYFTLIPTNTIHQKVSYWNTTSIYLS